MHPLYAILRTIGRNVRINVHLCTYLECECVCICMHRYIYNCRTEKARDNRCRAGQFSGAVNMFAHACEGID